MLQKKQTPMKRTPKKTTRSPEDGKRCRENRDCKSGECTLTENKLLGGRDKRGTCRQYLTKRQKEGLVNDAPRMSRERVTQQQPKGIMRCQYPKFGAYPQCTTSDECERKFGLQTITDEYIMLCRYNCCVMREIKRLGNGAIKILPPQS
ncbi:hypothetical protein Ddc_21108 [Ditylenchus destructor]|nr:hypothetical protein Ddc_21108 [Ditylenchus destructor]